MADLVRRVRRRLPEPLKPPLRHLAGAVDWIPRAVERLRPDPPRPVPPRRIRASVGQPSASRYREEGAIVAGELQELLESLGRPVSSFESICDLASGPGKILGCVRWDTASSVTAVDVNADAIDWLRRQMPRVKARAEQPWPPTMIPAGSFDLIYSISLFTHLSERAQDAWVAEVSRLLKPGGLGVITVHGIVAFEGFKGGRRQGISEGDAAALRRCGSLEDEAFVFLPEAHPDRRTPGVESDWGLAFHGHSYIRQRWTDAVRVDAILPSALNFSQDVVIVRPNDSKAQ